MIDGTGFIKNINIPFIPLIRLYIEHLSTNVLWVYTDTLFCPGHIVFNDKSIKGLY